MARSFPHITNRDPNLVNTPKKPPLSIKAEYIGPIMKLDQQLSSENQNLIFARNGIGKSFMARALRSFDKSMLSPDEDSAISDLLVSEESPNGYGTFSLHEGDVTIGSLELSTKQKNVSRTGPEYIFHVFSEDYVTEHIRNRLEYLDGEISHEIIVGKENVDLDQKIDELSASTKTHERLRTTLDKSFAKARLKLKGDFSINAALKSFRTLQTNPYLESSDFQPDDKLPSRGELLSQYNRFKTLPSDPELPQDLHVSKLDIREEELLDALSTITSPSTVAEELRRRISKDSNFIETGLLLYDENPSECPFCTQTINQQALNAIGAYVEYFDDREAKERKKIGALIGCLQDARRTISTWKADHLTSKTHFDDVKAYFPSFNEKRVLDSNPAFQNATDYLDDLEQRLEKKLTNLTIPVELPAMQWQELQDRIHEIANGNNQLFADLEKMVSNSSVERKGIQNAACEAFSNEFFVANHASINNIVMLKAKLIELREEVELLKQKSGEKAPARDRVVKSFSDLLRRFFGDKYSFDGSNFKLQRNNKKMLRGGDRTLSDGEKSVIAFCYFLAQCHLRVESNEEYRKLFLVFDDPVTSMSYDYIYSIIQCLKLLRISDEGEIQFNLQSDLYKPKMLMLTHNSYFFNIASTNRLVKKNALYQLTSNANGHELRSQTQFATPHLLQLEDVFDVSQGTKEADHTTANSIRSVLEGIWRFCRPDLSQFGDFVKFLISEHGIEIKSILINDLCHGGKFSDAPHSEEDIRIAAQEAVKVVNTFAEGQLNGLSEKGG